MHPFDVEADLAATRRTLLQFAEKGDNPELPREVSHYFFFSHAAGHVECREILIKRGFNIQFDSTKSPTFDEENDGYTLTVTRADKVTFEHITQITRDLGFLAEEFDGNYDGWDAPIVR